MRRNLEACQVKRAQRAALDKLPLSFRCHSRYQAVWDKYNGCKKKVPILDICAAAGRAIIREVRRHDRRKGKR